MATITEDYVSFETAKLLKEKGFDEKTIYHYTTGDTLQHNIAYNQYKNSEMGNACSAPTIQMAMKWLREVHGLFISIGNDDLDYNWQIFDIKNRTKDLDPTCLTDSYGGYRKYELACTLAIKYCLENLI